jgi:hypothetical protein
MLRSLRSFVSANVRKLESELAARRTRNNAELAKAIAVAVCDEQRRQRADAAPALAPLDWAEKATLANVNITLAEQGQPPLEQLPYRHFSSGTRSGRRTG